jgi:Icc protein
MKSPPSNGSISRRGLMKFAGGALVATSLPFPVALHAEEIKPSTRPNRALRLAHLTDVHVEPERRAGEGLAQCLRHAQRQADGAQFILTGGDAVMDVFKADAARAKVQSDLWKSVWKQECSVDVEHCIGNHDIWGWNKQGSKTKGDEKNWGKQWALDFYGLTSRYRSFDRAGWHFIVLDSVQPGGNEYIGKLDDAQFDWLRRDLQATPPTTPTLVLSHIPIFSIAAYMNDCTQKNGDWYIAGGVMHVDARQIKDLFYQHKNVRLCVSGHIHMLDRCEYLCVTYVCGGAVSGKWWRGPLQETREGYSLIDLYPDGTFDVQYVAYDWQVAQT